MFQSAKTRLEGSADVPRGMNDADDRQAVLPDPIEDDVPAVRTTMNLDRQIARVDRIGLRKSQQVATGLAQLLDERHRAGRIVVRDTVIDFAQVIDRWF